MESTNYASLIDMRCDPLNKIKETMVTTIENEIKATKHGAWHQALIQSLENGANKTDPYYDASDSCIHIKLKLPADESEQHIAVMAETLLEPPGRGVNGNRHRGDDQGNTGVYAHPGTKTYRKHIEDNSFHTSPTNGRTIDKEGKPRHLKGLEHDGQNLQENVTIMLKNNGTIASHVSRLGAEFTRVALGAMKSK